MFVMVGLLAEMLVRIYHESQGKATYVVKEMPPARSEPERERVDARPLIRVLFLTESFHPVLGGGERHIRALGRDLARTGTPVTVLTRRGEDAWPADETFEGMHIVRVPPPGPGRAGKYRMVPHVLAALHRLRRAYDVLVVRGTRVLGLPGVLAARAAGKRVILQPEVNGEMSGEVYTWGQPFAHTALGRAIRVGTSARNLLLCDADGFVAMSRLIREEFLAAGVPEEKVAHIPHGTTPCASIRPPPASARRPVRALGQPGDACVIAYTGRLPRGRARGSRRRFRQGGGRCAVRASPDRGLGAGQALSVEDDLRAAVVREGPARASPSPGDWIEVSGAARHGRVRVPVRLRGPGLSLIEAAATGPPAVARARGIVDVIEDGASGWLVARETGALAARLARWCATPPRACASARGREIAEAHFDEEGPVRYRALGGSRRPRRFCSARRAIVRGDGPRGGAGPSMTGPRAGTRSTARAAP
jgi:glycosyltransferase involved in cell wall biosynthesis